MTQWRLQADSFARSRDGEAVYGMFFGAASANTPVRSGTESDVECRVYTAFIASDFRVFVSIAGVVGNTVTLRDDGVSSTNQSIDVGGTSGWVEDLTGTHLFGVPSDISVFFNNTGMHGDSFDLKGHLLTLEHASIDAPMMGGGTDANVINTRHYSMGTGWGVSSTDEALVAHQMQRATVMQNIYSNTAIVSSPDFDIGPTKNGSISTNLVVNRTGSGKIEDTSGSESYADGDTISFTYAFTSGETGAFVTHIEADTESTWLTSGNFNNVGERDFAAFTNNDEDTTADDNYFMRIGSTLTANLQMYVSVGDTSSCEAGARVGAVNSSNLLIDIGTSTGYLEDLTGSDTISDGTSLMATATGASNTLDLFWVGLECPWTDPSGEPDVRNRYHITSS